MKHILSSIIILFFVFSIFASEFTFALSKDLNETIENNYNIENNYDDHNFSITAYPFITGCFFLFNSLDTQSIFISTEFEWKLNNYVSLASEFRGMYIANSSEYSTLLNVGPGFRFYFNGTGMQGWFQGHYIQFSYLAGKGDDYSSSSLYMPNNLYMSTHYIGYKKLFNNCHVEVSIGLVIFNISGESSHFAPFPYPIVGLGIGKSF